MKKMKKGKTFLTLLSMAGIITVITLAVSNAMTAHLEYELAKKTTNQLVKLPTPTPTITVESAPTTRPTLPPSPTPVTTPEPTPLPTPVMLQLTLPVSGAEVLSDYTEDTLVFQATYGDYRTHTGIDFGDDKETPVHAAADGIVVRNAFDYEQGYTVEISHEGGYLTRYSNLLGDQTVSVGQEVLQGEMIGAVGDSGVWESHLPCHLHFELEQNGEPCNPQDYFYSSLTVE